MKLLRTIRLDPTDTLVFDQAAEPGEWAISGAFMFAGGDPAALSGKSRAAFRGGLLGVQSFGWSTLAEVVAVSDYDRKLCLEMLVNQFCDQLGAPNVASASKAAEEELAFAASLCVHEPGVLIAVQRTFEDGEIRETFRSLKPRDDQMPMRVFSFVEVDDEADEADETINLIELAAQTRGKTDP